MNGSNFFKDSFVEKGDTAYILSRSIASCNGEKPITYYRIEPCTVTAVGRDILTVKPQKGGNAIKFERIPSFRPAYGLYLERVDAPGGCGWRDRLFLDRKLVETYKANREKADAEQSTAERRKTPYEKESAGPAPCGGNAPEPRRLWRVGRAAE